MQHSKIKLSQSNTENETSIATLLISPCENIGLLLSCLRSDTDRGTKSKIIDHIFDCDNCYGSFKDFMALTDLIDAFSADAHQHTNPSCKGTFIQRTSPLLIAWPKLVIVPIAIIMVISILYLSSIKTPSLDGSFEHVSWRGTPLFNYFEVYPFPYAVILRNSLRFTICCNSDFHEWQIFIFDAGLDLFWQSGRSDKLTIIPDKSVLNFFKKRSIYYWKYIENVESGPFRESELIPFFIAD